MTFGILLSFRMPKVYVYVDEQSSDEGMKGVSGVKEVRVCKEKVHASE